MCVHMYVARGGLQEAISTYFCHLNPEFANRASLATQLALRIPVSFQALDKQGAALPTQHLHAHFGDPNSGPPACVASALTPELSPEPHHPVMPSY